MSGTLYLVPNLLGLVPPADVLPTRTIEVARRLAHWVVETPKPARWGLATGR
jgi:16S rRNA C1402 (ribose-2'-O) methylase RsmI